MKIEIKRSDLFELAIESIEAGVFVVKCENFIKKKYNLPKETVIIGKIQEKIRQVHINFRKKYLEKYHYDSLR